MSQSASFRIEMERRAHQLAAARETTLAFVERYRDALRDMHREGLSAYMPEEVARTEDEVARIVTLVESDAEAASSRSQALAPEVLGLPRLARVVQREAEAAFTERVRVLEQEKEHARDDLEAAWRTALMGWQDALARDLARVELAALRQRLAADVEMSPQDLARDLEALRRTAETMAREFRTAKAEATRVETQRDAAEATLAVVAEVGKETPAAVAAARKALDAVSALAPGEFAKRLADVTRSAEAGIVDERVRREAVHAVLQSLRDTGFIVDAPWRRVEGGRDEVVIRARKPAGHQAEFRVTLTGDLDFKFDHYQGAACKKDIAAVLPKLQDIYGVRLSNRRVSWENPDDLSRTARQVPGGNEEGKHGR